MSEAWNMSRVQPEIVQSIAWYRFNTGVGEIISQVYGEDIDIGYRKEKEGILRDRGLLWLFCQLDGAHRNRFCSAIEDRYLNYILAMEERRRHPAKGGDDE